MSQENPVPPPVGRLQTLWHSYVDFPLCMDRRQALKYIIADNMRRHGGRHSAQGLGRPAWRRALRRLDEIGDSIKALERRIARNRRQWAADEAAERHSEGRIYFRMGDMVNFHDE